MLFGTADVDEIAKRSPTMERFASSPLVLEGVEILQVAFEAESHAIEAVLPPALHPTIPPLVTWLVWRCPGGPLGSFTMTQARVSCRSGVRPRAFLLTAAIDGSEAAARLSAEWGYRCEPARVLLQRGYDRISAVVRRDGNSILDVSLLDPDPLGADDVQYTAGMHLARTPRGVRLVQVDPDYRVRRAERGKPRLDVFDGTSWSDPRVMPQDPVSASFAVADLTLPRIRFLCRADVMAFEGTESLA